MFTPVPGLTGVACRLDGLTDPDVCSPETLDPKLAAFIAKRVTAAQRAVAKAEEATKERKGRRQIRKIFRQLKKTDRRVGRFERKERITPGCAAILEAQLCRIVTETDVPDLAMTPCPFL